MCLGRLESPLRRNTKHNNLETILVLLLALDRSTLLPFSRKPLVVAVLGLRPAIRDMMRPSSLADADPDGPKNKEEVLARIREVRDSPGLKDYPLYSRSWKELCPTVVNEASRRIRVMQFNLLAEGLSAGECFISIFTCLRFALHALFLSPSTPHSLDPEIKAPFEDGRFGKKSDKSTWGGFDSIQEPGVVLNFSTRKYRILEEILRHGPDIIALQEVDRYHDFFGPLLNHLGYDSRWSCKLDSPSLKFGYFSDGVSICWRKDRFDLIEDVTDNEVEFKEEQVNVNHVLLTLKPKDWAGEPFVCVTTHLKAKATAENEQIRSKQITALLTKVTEFAIEHKAGERILLCGDFNCDPFDIYKTEGGQRELDYKAICVPHIEVSEALQLLDDETQSNPNFIIEPIPRRNRSPTFVVHTP